MKIFIINPDFGVTPEQMAARCHLLSVHVGPDVELHMECLVENHIEIDSALDAALAAPEIIKWLCVRKAKAMTQSCCTASVTPRWMPVVRW